MSTIALMRKVDDRPAYEFLGFVTSTTPDERFAIRLAAAQRCHDRALRDEAIAHRAFHITRLAMVSGNQAKQERYQRRESRALRAFRGRLRQHLTLTAGLAGELHRRGA